jgi:hypothetical protein
MEFQNLIWYLGQEEARFWAVGEKWRRSCTAEELKHGLCLNRWAEMVVVMAVEWVM